MFSYQPFAPSSFFKESIDAQISFFNALSKSFFDASMQIGEFSTQTMQNVIETSVANFQRSLKLSPVSDLGALFRAQPQSPYALFSAYQPASASVDTRSASADPTASPSATAASHQPAATVEASAVSQHSGHGTHATSDTSPKPSTLIEKMIASVVEEPNNGDKNPGGAGT